MKPDINQIIEDASDLLKHITNKLPIGSAKADNPRYTEPGETKQCTVDKVRKMIYEKQLEGMVGADEDVTTLLRLISTIDHHVNIHIGRIEDMWRKQADAIKELVKYIEELEQVEEELKKSKSENQRMIDDFAKYEKERAQMIKDKLEIKNIGLKYMKQIENVGEDILGEDAKRSSVADSLIEKYRSAVEKILNQLSRELDIEYRKVIVEESMTEVKPEKKKVMTVDDI